MKYTINWTDATTRPSIIDELRSEGHDVRVTATPEENGDEWTDFEVTGTIECEPEDLVEKTGKYVEDCGRGDIFFSLYDAQNNLVLTEEDL